MFATIVLAAASLAADQTPSDACTSHLAKTCALVELIATEMTSSLKETAFVVGEFQLESFSASGPVLQIVQRTTYSESEFEKAFPSGGLTSAEYVGILHDTTLKTNCSPPTRAIVVGGGSIVTTILFKDGGVLDIQTVSACPEPEGECEGVVPNYSIKGNSHPLRGCLSPYLRR